MFMYLLCINDMQRYFLVIKFVWIAHWQRNNVFCDKGRTYKFQIVINDDLCIQIKIHAYLKRLTKKEGLIYSVLKKWFVHLSIGNHKMVYDKTIFVLCIQWSKYAQSLLLCWRLPLLCYADSFQAWCGMCWHRKEIYQPQSRN